MISNRCIGKRAAFFVINEYVSKEKCSNPFESLQPKEMLRPLSLPHTASIKTVNLAAYGNNTNEDRP